MPGQRIIHTALLSIHDVMPETLTAVDRLLLMLGQIPPHSITLLVVPGRSWQQTDLDWLHRQQNRGYRLAGHGWLHYCDKPRSAYHRLHSLFLSRNVAEHLSLSRSGVHKLIARCHAWFAEQGLHSPTLYVPPAWAMGDIGRPLLQALPFSQYETLQGVYHSDRDLFQTLPLAGYEADTATRALLLRVFNEYHRRRAAYAGLPLRIGIHPYDLQHHLAADLLQDIERVELAHNYQSYRHAAAECDL